MATNITSGSGVFDDILSQTKRDHTQITSDTEDLTMDEDPPLNDEPESSTSRTKHEEKGRRESPHHGVRSSHATADFASKHVSSTDLNSVNQKIDLLKTMMNDLAPVVKTLNKVYEDPLIAESDENIDDSDVGPPIKQTKLATDTTEVPMGVVDSLVSEVNTEEKTSPANFEKIAKALDSILSVGLMNQWPPKERRPLMGLKIVSYLQPPE